MAQIGKYTIMFIIAIVIILLSNITDSTYLKESFSKDALLLGGGIFTIHAASVGILISQLSLLSWREKHDFTNTVSSIRKSLIESIICLALIIMGAIFQYSKSCYLNNPSHPLLNIKSISLIIQIVCISNLLYIIYDTINAILLSFKNMPLNNEK